MWLAYLWHPSGYCVLLLVSCIEQHTTVLAAAEECPDVAVLSCVLTEELLPPVEVGLVNVHPGWVLGSTLVPDSCQDPPVVLVARSSVLLCQSVQDAYVYTVDGHFQ